MADYTDKEFKYKYKEIVENIKRLTTAWDPSISDESDPGVAIAKSFCLFLDKIDYKIDYRNAQNSTENVSDLVEAERLFRELGYQMKRKRSASGEILLRYIGEEAGVKVPLFTQFSNRSGSITYTSIRAIANIAKGSSKSIKVQEGIPVRYTYENKDSFDRNDLTTNLRLPILGYSDIADNSIIICSNRDFDESGIPLVSDWLNTGESIFNSIQTDNIFCIRRDKDGNPYVQFFEESLPGLSNGIQIWVLSSAGAAGNLSKNQLTTLISTGENLSSEDFVITHPEFSNGKDEETLDSAAKNYYDTYGVNDTLVSRRDYEVAIRSITDDSLRNLVSNALVTGVDGNHQLVEILHTLGNKNNIILTRMITDKPTQAVLVDALKSVEVIKDSDYLESFRRYKDNEGDLTETNKAHETERLIRKSLFGKNTVSNDIKLIGIDREICGGKTQDGINHLFNRFIYDLASLEGTIIVDSYEEVDQIKDQVIEVIKSEFNAKNLVPGEMVLESEISSKIKGSIRGVSDCSFYYSNHQLSKSPDFVNELNYDEKKEIISRSVLRGDIGLFDRSSVQSTLGMEEPLQGIEKEINQEIFDKYPNSSITHIMGTMSDKTISGETPFLYGNEIVQFYKVAVRESTKFGVGVLYGLYADQYKIKTIGEGTISDYTSLEAGSVITKDSWIFAELNIDEINREGNIVELQGDSSYKFLADYTVRSRIITSNGQLKEESIIRDGSILNGKEVYAVTLPNDGEVDLKSRSAKLFIQATDGGDYVTIGGEEGNTRVITKGEVIHSMGPIPETTRPSLTNRLLSGTISTTVEDSYKIPKGYYYGIILNSDDSVELFSGDEYMLKEGEHFIFSDESRLDFVDLGSGTILRNSSNYSFVLDNKITYEDLESQLVPLISDPKRNAGVSGGQIEVINTEIVTYNPKENTEIGIRVGDNKIENTWKKVKGKIVITDSSNGEIASYGEEWNCRGGLVIKTGLSNIFRLYNNQQILLTLKGPYQNGIEEGVEETEFISVDISYREFTNNSGKDIYVLFSKPLYLNLIDPVRIPRSDQLKARIYFLESGSEGLSYTNEGGYSIRYEPKEARDFSLNILKNSKYLIEFKLNLVGGSSFSVESTAPECIILNNSSKNSIDKSGVYQLFVKNSSSARNTITFKFSNIEEGVSFIVTNIITVDGVNSDIDLIEEKNQTQLGFDPQGILGRIYDLTGVSSDEGISFDYFYEPESPLTPILDPMKFYDTQHIMNRNILTVIDLNYLKEHLRIVRRNR